MPATSTETPRTRLFKWFETHKLEKAAFEKLEEKVGELTRLPIITSGKNGKYEFWWQFSWTDNASFNLTLEHNKGNLYEWLYYEFKDSSGEPIYIEGTEADGVPSIPPEFYTWLRAKCR